MEPNSRIEIRSIVQHMNYWQGWVERTSPSAVNQKLVKSLAWMRAYGTIIGAFLKSAQVHSLIRPADQPLLNGALANWEQTPFITRLAVLSSVSEISDAVLRGQVDCAADVLDDFARALF